MGLKSYLRLKNFRRFSQALFLFLFFYLFIQTESKGFDELGYPVKIFLDFDPLIFLSTLLSSKTVIKLFYLSLMTLLFTLILGRVFCGWICPLGTLNNIVSLLGKKRRDVYRLKIFRLKYYILLFILATSILGLQLSGILDPLSILIRSLSISIYPAFNYGIRAFFDFIYSLNIKGIVELSELIYSGLKNTVLSFEQPFYRQGLFIGIIFLAIMGLNFFERRVWCRYLCPLGALLGIFARYSMLKRSISEDCNSCGVCERNCPSASIKSSKEWLQDECFHCFNCDDLCPQKAVSAGFFKEKAISIDLNRRHVFISIASGLITVPVIRINPFSRDEFINPKLIRPPGSLEERDFLKRCVRCGECMKVCITNGLQPALLDGGIEALWTPVLVPKLGYCEYRCTLCGQVCPTGAIMRLSLEEKLKTKIGLAMIDKGRCLPWAHAIPCIVCEEVCPTSKKAIWFEKVTVKNRDGKRIELQQPHVDLELCIGCGICEAKCPVIDRPAIYVTNIGETRSKIKRLLLQDSYGGGGRI
ncbi:MAG: 4Fe-4S binding protein [Thermodesulfovibrionales bacterium]|nr:4Fe-4S binding protein [Thermodesulfovibrionales bacterium]